MNRQEFERRRRRRLSAERYAAEADRERALNPEAKPSDYDVRSLDDALQSAIIPAVVLYCRVSGRKQDLDSQLKGSRHFVADRGIRVARSHGETAKGRFLDPQERPALHAALSDARRRGVPLVVPCSSRIVRNSDYDAYRQPDLKPTVAEFEQFAKLADGITVLTLSDPDASCPDDEAFLRKLTADATGRPVGRPRKRAPGFRKDRRDRLRARVRALRRQGLSLRKIADVLTREGFRVTHTAVANWLKGRVSV